MKNENLNNALSNLDISFIENHLKEKEKYARKRKFKAMLVRFGATAACVAFIATSIILPIRLANIPPDLPPGSSSSQVTTNPNQDQQTTLPNPGQTPGIPSQPKLVLKAGNLAYIVSGGPTYGTPTNAYTTVYAPNGKYLGIQPIPDDKVCGIYEVKHIPGGLDENRLKGFIDGMLPQLIDVLDPNASVPQYEVKKKEPSAVSSTVYLFADFETAGCIFGFSQNGERFLLQLRSSGYHQKTSFNGRTLEVDRRNTDEEILESLEPVKNSLFEIFGVEFSGVNVERYYDGWTDGGPQSVYVTYYPENSDGLKDGKYIEIQFNEFLNEDNGNYLSDVKIIYEYREETNLQKLYDVELISLTEAEELLYKGYVFGGHSCPKCMSMQDKISFEDYDYVGMEYLYGYTDDKKIYRVAAPFYVFYKEIGIFENGNKTYAKTYVAAFEVEGMDVYFNNQISKHVD